MNPGRTFAAALAATLLFAAAVIGFAALRPEYSHLTKAVSELGDVGAPNALAFNLLGYILPGLLLALAGWGVGRFVTPRGVWLPLLLAVEGVSIAFAGVFPADMEHPDALTTRLHVAGSTAGLVFPIAWLPAAIAAWRTQRTIALVGLLAVAAFLAAFALYGFVDHRGPVQRLTFAIAFATYLAAAFLVWRRARGESR
jgi:hypothetical membrane protein